MTSTTRSRLRFDGLDHERFPDGSCRVRVRLEWGGVVHEGEAEGMQAMRGELRTSARATLFAAQAASGDPVGLSLMGLKVLRAFDALVIIASVRAGAEDGTRRLLGCQATTEDEAVEASARTVLDAINRVLERHITGGEDDGRDPSGG